MQSQPALRVAVLVLLSPLGLTQTPVNLIGGGQTPASHVIQRQQVCNPATMVCAPVPLGALPARSAGGSAYDPIRQEVWDSDGPNLVGVSALGGGAACTVLCPTFPAPGLPPGAFITGLAFEENGTPTGILWSVDSALGLQSMTWTNPRCPNQGPRCSIAPFMPTPLHQSGGLAISERHRLIFFSASDFTAGNPPNNWVFAAPLTAPCQPSCRLPIQGCAAVGLGPITGAAFDDCRSMLYLTDGRVTAFGVFAPASPFAPCSFTPVGCCINALLGPWYGLDLEASHSTNIGSSCLTPPCVLCPGMSLDEVGDASLFNTNFGYRLTGAPAGALAFCFGDVGGCTPGVPALCGLVHWPFVSLFLIGSAPTAGAGCGATAFHPLAIPLNPSLCGIPLTAQDLVLCPSGALFGTGLSNACCTMISDT